MAASMSPVTKSWGGFFNNPTLPVSTRVANISASKTPAGLAGQGNLVRPLPGIVSGAVQGTATAGATRPQVIKTQKNPGHWHNPTGGKHL